MIVGGFDIPAPWTLAAALFDSGVDETLEQIEEKKSNLFKQFAVSGGVVSVIIISSFIISFICTCLVILLIMSSK